MKKAILTALFMTGCATQAPPPDPALARLAAAAASVQDTWVVIGGIEKRRDPEYIARMANWGKDFPEQLKKRVTIRWTGPMEPVVEKLAQEAGLPFKVFGAAPPTPLNVVFNAQEEQIGDVLRDIGYQVGSEATIKITGPQGDEAIEVIYAPR